MRTKKQTAVEWLEKEFVELEHIIGVHFKMYELIDQAKEMEKQQQDDYAIDFAEWLYKWDNTRLQNGNWTIGLGLKPLISKEVLEQFKKEKGL